VIFANAGLVQLAPFGTEDEKFYDLHFDANVKGCFSPSKRRFCSRSFQDKIRVRTTSAIRKLGTAGSGMTGPADLPNPS
jgi:hypothetical protein